MAWCRLSTCERVERCAEQPARASPKHEYFYFASTRARLETQNQPSFRKKRNSMSCTVISADTVIQKPKIRKGNPSDPLHCSFTWTRQSLQQGNENSATIVSYVHTRHSLAQKIPPQNLTSYLSNQPVNKKLPTQSITRQIPRKNRTGSFTRSQKLKMCVPLLLHQIMVHGMQDASHTFRSYQLPTPKPTPRLPFSILDSLFS